jgi:hypothetical protein
MALVVLLGLISALLTALLALVLTIPMVVLLLGLVILTVFSRLPSCRQCCLSCQQHIMRQPFPPKKKLPASVFAHCVQLAVE